MRRRASRCAHASATRANRRCSRWLAGCARARPAAASRRRRGCMSSQAQADAFGLGRRARCRRTAWSRLSPRGAALEHVHLHRLGAAAQVHAVEAAKARAVVARQAGQHLGGDQRLVVAGVVEQARRDVDGIAVAVAGHLDDLAARQRDLQAQRAQARRGAALAAARDDVLERVVHAVGGVERRLRVSNTAIRPSPSVLISLPPHCGTMLRERRDGVRDDRSRLGVAERFVQRRAAAQVGEQDGALGDQRHASEFSR